MTRFTLTLDGFAAESGERLATVRLTNCQVPSRGAATAPTPTPSPTPNVKAVALSARAATGPLTVSISNAEFTSDVTVLTISIENAADVEVSLFSAIGGATLTDNTGKAYAVRMLRSDLPDRVPARGRIQGRLAFEPLPPTVTSAILTVPEIRIGDDVYEIKADLRF